MVCKNNRNVSGCFGSLPKDQGICIGCLSILQDMSVLSAEAADNHLPYPQPLTRARESWERESCHTHVSVSRHIGRDADGCLSLLTVHSLYNREYYVTVPLCYTTWVQGFEIRRIKSLFSFHKHVPPFIFPVPCCHRLKLSPDCHRVNLKWTTLRLEMWGTGS